MPMINSKISVEVSQEKRDLLKEELGKAVSILGKPESFLMLGFEDKYDLYFGGKKMEKGAFVSVDLYGTENPSACDKMTAKICQIYKDVLDIDANCIYVTFAGYKCWGWNNAIF